MEYKHFKFSVKKISDNGEFEGYAAVKGNVDSYGDIIEHGAFKRTILNQKVFPILFMHDPAKPIGISQYIIEDKKGLFTRGKLDLSTELGKMAYSGLKNGYISEMSIGYKVIQDDMNAKGHRLLKEVKLLEYSLITKGFAANELAQVSGFKSQDIMQRLTKLETALKERKKQMTCRCGGTMSRRKEVQEELEDKRKRRRQLESDLDDSDEVIEDDMGEEEFEELSRRKRNNRNEEMEEEIGEEEMCSRRRRGSKDSEELDEEDSDLELERRRRRKREDEKLDLVEWAEEEEEEPEHQRSRMKPGMKDQDETFDEDEEEAEQGMKPAPPKRKSEAASRELHDLEELRDRIDEMIGNKKPKNRDDYEEGEEWLSRQKPDKKSANSQTALSQKEWNSSFDTSFMQVKVVSGSTSLPLAPKDHHWDAGSAKKRVFEWAGEKDSKGFEPRKAKEAFFYFDPKNPRLKGSYKLPFADIIDGKLHAVPRAVSAVQGALDGARGGVEIPAADKSRIRSKVNAYKKRMGEAEKKQASVLIREMKDILGGF